MAIAWLIPRYIQRSRGGNAVKLVAYITRSQIWDERIGELWDGTRKIASLIHAEAMLPAGAHERFHDVQLLVNAIDASEKRQDSVLGRDFVIPLPRGADLETKMALARGFLREHFVDHGVPVILALHRAHTGRPGQKENDHAHAFVGERYLEGDRFSEKKSKLHEPEVRTARKRFVAHGVNWSAAWREYQEAHGISVDPPALVPGKHLGPGHTHNPTSELSKRQAALTKVIGRITKEVSENRSLEAEMRSYVQALTRQDAEAAAAAGISKTDIVNGMIGVVRIQTTGDGAMWQPDAAGKRAFVTPVRIETGNSAYDIESPYPAVAVRRGEIIDIVAWHPAKPGAWATRTGEAVALGAVEYKLADEKRDPLQVHLDPLDWLRARCEGIVLLTKDVMERRLTLEVVRQIHVRDPKLREELRRVIPEKIMEGEKMLDDLRNAVRVGLHQHSIAAGIDDYRHSKFAREQAEDHYNREEREKQLNPNAAERRDQTFVRVEGIDFITNGSTAEQRALFAQMEQNRKKTAGLYQSLYERGPEREVKAADRLRPSREIERISEESGLSPRRADGRLQPWTKDRATPSQALYARYKTEKTIALGARKEAEQAIYDRWSTYQNDLRGFYDLRREQEKLNAKQPSRIDRQNAHELLHAQYRGDRVAATQTRTQQLAAARRDHPLPTWDAFLSREAGRGDREAARLLEQRQEKVREQEQER